MENKIIEITAKEGMYLTQNVLEDENNRIFVKKISGYNIKAEDWRDATEEEKRQWEEEHKPLEE